MHHLIHMEDSQSFELHYSAPLLLSVGLDLEHSSLVGLGHPQHLGLFLVHRRLDLRAHVCDVHAGRNHRCASEWRISI